MIEVYLYTARFLLQQGYKRQGLAYLALALAECNKELEHECKGRVLAAMSHARRIP